MTASLGKFTKNYQDVERLFEIHAGLTGGVKGKNRHLTKPLLKSAIVLLTAAFEAYVEDVCVELSSDIAKSLKDPVGLPKGVKQKIVNSIHQAEKTHQLAAWELSSEGWRDLYKVEVKSMCDGLDGGLNTPNAKNVRELLKSILGVADVTQAWGWQGITPENACKKLNNLVKLRGAMAHGQEPTEPLSSQVCQSYNVHILRLVELVDEAAVKAVKDIFKKGGKLP